MSTPKRQITRLKDFVRCLEGAKREYKTKWALYENDIIDQFEHISQLLFSENPPVEEIVDIIKKMPPEIREMLYYIHPGYFRKLEEPKKLRLMLTNTEFRSLLRTVKSIKRLDPGSIEHLKTGIGSISIPEIEVGISIISTWASIVNPYLFIPVHGKIISRELRSRIEEYIGFKVAWGGPWRTYVENYLEFVQILNTIKGELQIKTAFELAFYLSKLSKNSQSCLKNENKQIYLEITKPPENHMKRTISVVFSGLLQMRNTGMVTTGRLAS